MIMHSIVLCKECGYTLGGVVIYYRCGYILGGVV